MQQMYVYAWTLGDGSNGGVYIYTSIYWAMGVARCGGMGWLREVGSIKS